jgi:acyl transferase domain-containing protein/acyl carrier protein
MMTSPDEAPASAATLRRAYLALDRMQSRLDDYERARSEPIAIVGLGCRFPGGAVDAATYWDVLRSGTDAVGEIPAGRWDADAFYDTRPQQPGKMSTRWGGFLDRVDTFDYDFFGIARREALAMDPQQRLTLEVAWEALENAGLAPLRLAGSRTGVFMGVCNSDFGTETFRRPADITAYASTGTSHSVVAGRLSYLLDLRGPSLAIDTACSSSLVAMHVACQSLRAGESDLAVSGGVNVVLSPLPSIAFSQFPGAVAPDGRCRTFDARANGYVRGEGCGAVILKRLSDAVRDGDQILALIRGSAINQDGRSSGVTAPSGAAQRDVLRSALEASGVQPHEVSYIEAHGTGTKLGDPIEVEALAEVYGRDNGAPVYLGAAKTNIGHTEAAAGIAGLIKVVLSLGHGTIPPNVHFEQLNPHISFAGTTFAVPTAATPWPGGGPARRIAGLSSFGFSGTNAHMILEAAPAGPATAGGPSRPRSLLALSARSSTALAEMARRYASRLTADGGMPGSVADVCFSANTGRSHLRCRLAATGATAGEIAGQLAGFADGRPGDGSAAGEAGPAEVVFLFTGQGPQRPGMARELYQTEPAFRAIIDRCDGILRPLMDQPLLSLLYPGDDPGDPDGAPVYQTAYSQPALFAIEYAIAELWRSWGVEPAAVLGHSFGEYIAACVAGMMTLDEGLKLAVERGRLMQALAQTGAMAAVFAPEDEVAEAISEHQATLSIAAVNGPASTAISGDRETVAAVCEQFRGRGIQAKPLHITTSSHSPLIEPVLGRLHEAASSVRFTRPQIPLVSNLTGELWPWDKAPDADYWCRHARQPVRFAAGLAALRALGYRAFLEVGPAPTLLGLISDGMPADGDLLLPSLRPKQDDWAVMLSSLSRLYARGADVDWDAFDRGYPRARVAVPTYPFDQTRCWQAPAPRHEGDAAAADTPPAEGDDDLLYQLAWHPRESVPASRPGPEGARQAWLVLADGAGVGDQLASAVAGQGARCVRVVPGEEYRYDGHGQAVIRADDPADLVRLLAETDTGAGETLNVVHLRSLDAGAGAGTGLLRSQQAGCTSAVRAAQALAASGSTWQPRLWLVTRGAQLAGQPGNAPGHGPVAAAVAQSALWGLGRSMQQEHSRIWGGLVDLDPGTGPGPNGAHLLAEIGSGGQASDGGREDQVAFRGGQRYVARLVRAPLPDGPARGPGWRTDASYLISGGLTGIGLAVARSMVRAGARRLVLVGRTPIPPRSEWPSLPAGGPVAARVAGVRELESLGASVILASLDISDEDAVRGFLDRFDAEGWPPIRGVVHSAGTGEVAPLADLTPEDLDRHLRPKAGGAWVLHKLFAGRPLDFFVLFSSTSSILSSPFVASYAAANAFLDALADLRRAEGKPGLSIDWGIWEQTGLASRAAEATPGLSPGMGTLDPDQAVRAFHRLLRHDAGGHMAVVPVDWATWGSRYTAVSGSALLDELLGERGGERPARPDTRPALPSRSEVLALPPGERVAMLTERLQLAVTGILGAEPGTARPEQSLIDLGLDSLMAVELRNEAERRLGFTLAISVLLEGASVQDLAGQIAGSMADGAEATADGGPPRGPEEEIARAERDGDLAAALLAEIAGLSDGEASAALDREAVND